MSGYTVKLRKNNKYHFIAKLRYISKQCNLVGLLKLPSQEKINLKYNTTGLDLFENFTHRLLWESPASVALVTLLLYPGLFQPSISHGTPGGWSQKHVAALQSSGSALLLYSNNLCLDQSHFRHTQSQLHLLIQQSTHQKGKYFAGLWY